MSSIFDKIYANSPSWFQNIGLSTYGLIWQQRRFGGNFKRYVVACEQHESYSHTEWQDYQTHRLQELLTYATKHVPYYQKKLNYNSRLNFDSFSLEDLTKLPLLEKESIRAVPESFIAENISPHKLHVYHSSGTTGTPIDIMFTNDMHRHWSAYYETRVRRWAGVNNKMSRAMIGGRLVVPNAAAEPPFWRFNLAERQLYMSAFHISPKNAHHYVDALNRYKPDYLVGYASSHFFLARMIVEQNLKVIQPKAVLTSSEKLTKEMRMTIEDAYHCQAFDAYSGVEACCLASECEYHRMHISPDVGIVELINENGYPVKPGEPGEIVATGLLNFVQPLIRYRTGDLAVWSTEACPCGRNMPIIDELMGRLEDMVIGSDGRETVRFHGIFVGLPHIHEGQVIQHDFADFEIKLVVDEGFNDEERQVIYKRFRERLGPVTLRFNFVDRIERTRGGKFRAVISHVQRSSHNLAQ